MANDPNRSGNGNSPNEIGDFGTSRLAEIASESRPSAEERELRRRAKVARKGVDIYESLTSEAKGYEPLQKLHRRNVNTLSSAEPRIRIAVEARQQRLTNQAVNTVAREFSESSINSQIADLVSSPEAQLSATSMMNVPYNDLVNQQRSRMARLNELGEMNRSMASRVIGRKGLNQDIFGSMSANAREAQGLMTELATIGAALGQQKSQGLDPKSRITDLFTQGAKAAAIVNEADTKKAIGAPGGLGGKSLSELKEMEIQASRKLISALEDLKNASGDAKKGFQELAESAAEDLSKVQTAIGMGGGGRGGGFNDYARIAQSGFGAAANAIQAIGVNQRLAVAQNVAGFADWENQKYKTYKAAASGDVASLLMLSQFAGAEGFGRQLGTAANLAVGAQAAGGVAQAAAGVAEGINAASPGAGLVGNMASGIKAGATDVLAGTATTAVAGYDIYRGVSAGQAELAGRQARLDVSRAINAVGAEQVQGFRDFGVGLGTAAIGMGASGNAFLRRTLSDANMSRMAGYRISPEQFAQMAQEGQAAMGSVFNENQIFAARGAEARGYGTMQENLRRMSLLASAGANNPQTALANVMEVALTKGLDSSKALNAVAEHTAAMASSSAGRILGFDTTRAASALLTAGITKDTPNKEAALERAASIQDLVRNIGTNIGTNYAGFVATARIGKTAGLGGVSSIMAQKLDTETLMTLQGMTPDQQREALISRGVDVRGKNAGAMVATLLRDRQMTLLEGGGAGFAVNYNKEAVLKAKSISDLSQTDRLGLAQAAGLAGFGSDKELFDAVHGITRKGDPNSPVGKAALTMPAADDKSLRTQMDKLRTLGFEQLTTAAQTAATNLGGAATAISKLTTAFEGLEKAMPSIEKSATTAAGRAGAGGAGLNVNGFNLAIDKLDKVLDKALGKVGASISTTDVRKKNAAPGP